jgi:pimeloyl-ACP methyl ester carboxylesterase
MYFQTSDNQNLYYEIRGNNKSKKSLLFLNGVLQDTKAWNLITPFFEKEYRIILCDFIFQGQSDKKGEYRTFDQHADDMSGLLRYLKIPKVSLIGISYGSLVAQHFALNHSDQLDRLILLSSFANNTPYFDAINLAWQRALQTGGYSLLLDVMLPNVLSEDYFNHPLLPINALKMSRESLGLESSAVQKLMLATQTRGDYRNKLKPIKNPTLIIHGEKDTLVTLQMGKELAIAIPNSLLAVIPKAGHTLNLEAVEQTVELIKEFL